MTKIEQIKDAIDKAEQFKSNLSPEVFGVPFLGSLKIRALLNNLGALGTHAMDIGCHKGGSACSMVFGNDNLKTLTAIDSWESDATNDDKARPQFDENIMKFKPNNLQLNIIASDCWEVLINENAFYKIDLYSYDAGHSRSDQRDALLYYKDVLADEFIYVCDDWTYQEVKQGTMDGIKEGGYEVLFERELLNPDGFPEDSHLNDHWWRGYYVALLKKKK